MEVSEFVYTQLDGGTEMVHTDKVALHIGIIHGDMIAESIISAVGELGPLRVPLVVRLQGTDAEKGQAIVRLHGSFARHSRCYTHTDILHH